MKYIKNFIIIILIMFLCSCNELVAVDTNKYIDVSKHYNLNIREDAQKELDNNKYISNLTISENNKFKSFFYIFNDLQVAIDSFDNEKAVLETQKNSVIYSETKVNLNNFNKYIIDTNDNYYYLIRVDNTLLYIEGKDNYKTEINSFAKELGYK